MSLIGLSSRLRYSSSLFQHLITLVDISAVFAAGYFCVRWYPGHDVIDLSSLSSNYILLQGLTCLTMVGVSSWMYSQWRGGELPAMAGRAALSWIISWGLALVWLVLSKSAEGFSRIWLVSWLVFTIPLLCICRVFAYMALRHLAKNGYSKRTVVLIDDGLIRKRVEDRADHSSWTGYQLVGSISPSKISEIESYVRGFRPDEIWISITLNDAPPIEEILHVLRHATADVRLILDFNNVQLMNHGSSVIMGYPMLDISHSPMRGVNVIVKALLDYVFSFLILLLISPLLLLIAIAIRIESKGSIIFKQQRHGWNGKLITVYKFRSMYTDQVPGNVVVQATKNDPRITKLGAFLRRTSLDELPQFINVLQGRLSVVGPRPHAVSHNELYKELVPRYMLRHKVKPGITGWAQINGYRGETNTIDKMQKRVEYDLHYIENWSLWLDCYIILMTVFKGFLNENAY